MATPRNPKRSKAMVNPFDLKTALLAKHAQHIVLIHFPIGLFLAAVAFDFLALWTKRRGLADAAYYNLLGAAISTFPVIVTGLARGLLASDEQAFARRSHSPSVHLTALRKRVKRIQRLTFFYRKPTQPLHLDDKRQTSQSYLLHCRPSSNV